MTLEFPTSKAERTDGFSSIEKDLPTTECLVILGGGVEEVTRRDKRTGELEKTWQPARYVMETDAAMPSRDKRVGTRKALEHNEVLDEHDTILGGNAYLHGGIQYLEETRSKGALPKRVIFSMSRPDYIDNVTSDKRVDEGSVMTEAFFRRTKEHPFVGVEVEICGENSKNTAGDLLNGLKGAYSHGHKSAVIIATEARLERTKATCTYLQEHFPKLREVSVTFITPEELLRRRYADNPARLREFEEMQQHLKKSPLWEETARRERKGVGDIKKGKMHDLRISEIDTSGLL